MKEPKMPTADSIKAAINEAETNGDTALATALCTLYGMDKQDDRSVTDRIKTFEDACSELGKHHPYVIQYKEIYDNFLDGADPKDSNDIVVYLKLRIIVAALNEGWKPEFEKGEYRWYPWFNLYTQEEIDRMDVPEKEKRRLCLWDGDGHHGTYFGIGCVSSNSVYSNLHVSGGTPFALRTPELATYAGQQFIEIYAEFQLKKQVKRFLKF